MTSSRHLLAALLIAAVAMACGPSTVDLGSTAKPPPTVSDSIAIPPPEATPGSVPAGSPPSPSGAPVATTTVRAYFYLGSFTGDASLVPVLRQIPATQAVGGAAMTALLAGPNSAELGASPAMYTAISTAARFHELSVSGGIATIDLSREFETDNGQGPLDMRIAQVVWTLTQFPTVSGVRFELDGAPPSAALDHTYTRSGTIGRLASISFDRPAWRSVLANPGRITGHANVFEATFRIEILGGARQSLANIRAMASCGTGCWGTFDVTVPYTVEVAQWGTLRAYDVSAKDGSKEQLVEYPVWLTP